jgi:hypothetical protein
MCAIGNVQDRFASPQGTCSPTPTLGTPRVSRTEYVTVHYELGDINREREPIAIEYMPRAVDLDPGVSEGYVAEALPTSIA